MSYASKFFAIFLPATCTSCFSRSKFETEGEIPSERESRKEDPSKTDGFFVGEFRISPVSYAQSCKSAKIVMISVKSKAFSNVAKRDP